MGLADDLTVRHDLRPADVDAVLRLHVSVYCDQLGFDGSFAEHVETPLRAWAERRTERDRVWLVERRGDAGGCQGKPADQGDQGDQGDHPPPPADRRLLTSTAAPCGGKIAGVELVGCVAVVEAGAAAQLRWFVLAESERGRGVGRWLLGEAVAFARAAGYRALFLWTVNTLTAAARAYTAAGFTLSEEVPGGWAHGMTEQRYELRLNEPEA